MLYALSQLHMMHVEETTVYDILMKLVLETYNGNSCATFSPMANSQMFQLSTVNVIDTLN